MSDMDAVTAAKSDQINADDLVGTELLVTVENVIIRAGTEQPITVKLVGHEKVFRPCKTVARIMKAAWGPDSSVYKGRSMLLYRDDNVTWGGMKVGGIRVRAISHITNPLALALQEKKGSRKMTTVQPLKEQPRQPAEDRAAKWAAGFSAAVSDAADLDALDALKAQYQAKLDDLQAKRPELASEAFAAFDARAAELSSAREGRTDQQHGDQHTDDEEYF